MLTIHAARANLPERVPFDAIQARQRHLGYGHMMLPFGVAARPRGRGRLDEGEASRFAAPPSMLPIADKRQSASDMAASVACALRDEVGPEVIARTSHVIVANGSLNQDIGDSIAGRVQYELGLKNILPFGVGQLGSVGFYGALPLLEAELRGGGQALLVTTDKWLYPFFRVFGDLVAYGDGAAALLIRHQDDPAWGTIRGHALELGTAMADPWALTPSQLRAALVPLAVSAGRRALAQAGLRADQVDAVVPAAFDDGFADAVANALEIPAQRRRRREAPGHASSSETPLAMMRVQASLPPGARSKVLFWDAALCGAAGAIVVDLLGSNSPSPNEPST